MTVNLHMTSTVHVSVREKYICALTLAFLKKGSFKSSLASGLTIIQSHINVCRKTESPLTCKRERADKKITATVSQDIHSSYNNAK